MTGQQLYCTIGYSVATGPVFTPITITPIGSVVQGQLLLAPQSGYYTGQPLLDMVNQFSRWRLRRHQLTYASRTPTTQGSSIVWAFSGDPMYLQKAGVTSGTAPVSLDAMQQCVNCKEFPVFHNYSLPVIDYKGKMLYVDGNYNNNTAPINYGSDTPTRDQTQGIHMFTIQGPPLNYTVGTNVIFGDIYIRYEIELCELGIFSTLLTSVRLPINHPAVQEVEEEKKKKINKLSELDLKHNDRLERLEKKFSQMMLDYDPAEVEEKEKDYEYLSNPKMLVNERGEVFAAKRDGTPLITSTSGSTVSTLGDTRPSSRSSSKSNSRK